MPQQQQQQEWGMRESTNLLYAVANAHATAITVFLRKGFGREALGWPGLWACALILVVACFNGSTSMFVYLGAWLVGLACQRLHTFSLIRKGLVWHSKYEGYPVFSRLAFGSEKLAVLVVEPLICAVVGYIFIDWGQTVVGWFILCGVGSLLVREAFHHTINQRRVQAMHDAQIENDLLARQYRNQG